MFSHRPQRVADMPKYNWLFHATSLARWPRCKHLICSFFKVILLIVDIDYHHHRHYCSSSSSSSRSSLLLLDGSHEWLLSVACSSGGFARSRPGLPPSDVVVEWSPESGTVVVVVGTVRRKELMTTCPTSAHWALRSLERSSDAGVGWTGRREVSGLRRKKRSVKENSRRERKHPWLESTCLQATTTKTDKPRMDIRAAMIT